MRVSILLYKVLNSSFETFYILLSYIQIFLKRLALQGAGGCIGDQQFAQQEDSAEASKHQSYQVKIIIVAPGTMDPGFFELVNLKLIMGWVGGDCGLICAYHPLKR